MTIFSDGRKVIDVNPRPAARLVGLAIAAFLFVILLFNSVTTVSTGNVGVLTFFGRVTGPVIGAGIHLINPLKSSRQMSIQTQELKESASVPSSEGLVINLDTSLIYHLNPDRAADVLAKLGPNFEEKIIEPTLR